MTFDTPGNSADRGGDDVASSSAGCPSFEQLSGYFDAELPETEMREIAAHVAQCAECTAILEDFQRMRSLLQSEELHTLPRSFALNADMVATKPQTAPRPVESLEDYRQRRNPARYLPLATAIAALFLIAAISGEIWTKGSAGTSPSPTPSSAEVIMIGGTPVPVDDSQFSAASSSPINSAGSSSSGIDWWNWWRLPEIVLALILLVLIVTIVERRRARRI